ncbi:hypothetical protein AKJ16_DCAP14717 [Drosera capensis]
MVLLGKLVAKAYHYSDWVVMLLKMASSSVFLNEVHACFDVLYLVDSEDDYGLFLHFMFLTMKRAEQRSCDLRRQHMETRKTTQRTVWAFVDGGQWFMIGCGACGIYHCDLSFPETPCPEEL